MTVTTNRSAGTIRASLRSTSFRRLLLGLAVSQIGDWLYNLALVALVFERTHSTIWVGITTAARVVPFVVFGPLGGALADRVDRRRLMIAADVVRLVLMALLAFIAVAHLPIALAPAIAALATIAATPYLPCVAATTPRLVDDADLPGANAARSAVASVGLAAGPAIGGLLLVVGSPALAFAINAVTFGLSAVAVLAIPASAAFTPGRAGGVRPHVFNDVAAGIRALRSRPAALQLVGADVLCSFVYGAQTVLLVLVARRLGLGVNGYGYLIAGFGLGGIVATSLASRLMRVPRPRLVLAMALAAVALPMPLLAADRSLLLAIVFTAVGGAGAALVEILTETGLQRMLDDAVFGRAYGFALPASIGGIVVGALIAPVLVDLVGGAGSLILIAVAVFAYAIIQTRRSQSLTGAARALVGRNGPSTAALDVAQSA